MTAPSIEFLSAGRELDFPDEWYDLAGPGHFWLEGRLEFALAAASRAGIGLRAPTRVIEVGGGAGVLRDQLESRTDWIVDLAELNQAALTRARAGRGRLLCYDILDRRADLLASYGGLILFDVLEHIEPTRPFVEALLAHLRPGGWLLVNVPAIERLYGVYDVAAGHHRRYSPASLAAEFAPFGLEMTAVSYWGLSLVPLLVARRLLQQGRAAEASVIRRGFRPPGRAVNALLARLLRLECRLIGRPPLGTSLVLSGRTPS